MRSQAEELHSNVSGVTVTICTIVGFYYKDARWPLKPSYLQFCAAAVILSTLVWVGGGEGEDHVTKYYWKFNIAFLPETSTFKFIKVIGLCNTGDHLFQTCILVAIILSVTLVSLLQFLFLSTWLIRSPRVCKRRCIKICMNVHRGMPCKCQGFFLSCPCTLLLNTSSV